MKSAILCDPKFMMFWKREKYRDIRRISDCQGLGRRERESEKHRGFRTMMLQWWIHAIGYVCKFIEYTPRTVRPCENSGLDG